MVSFRPDARKRLFGHHTQAARRPHQFKRLEAEDITVHYDFGRMDEPEELHLDRKGLRKRTHRIEAFWNGSVFVDAGLPPP